MVLAILVILILTVVALAVAYFTETEDKISGNSALLKASLYAAETGLRSGESLIGLASAGGTKIATLIYQADGVVPLVLPGGKTAVPLVVRGIPYGGSQSGLPILSLAPGGGSRLVAYYALYVRNNDEDPGGTDVNTDQYINLLAVGMVYAPGADLKTARPLATKILEEQLMLSAQGNEFGAQKGANQGGTGAGTKG
jgi:hypothetical protein